MADNRHFTNAFQNEGGSPVYVEDKKLAERTPVPSAASIANLKFLLVNDDTEGFETAIKAYIDEAIRSALGALVNNLDKGTAISRILATDGNNDLGTITPANLSSVLGGMIREIYGTIPTPLAIKRDIGDWGKEATVQLEFGFEEDTGENMSGYFSVSRNSGSLIWHNNKTGVDTTLA